MPTNLFLSHSHQDKRSASTVRDVLRYLSAGQLDVWFSSDNRPSGGILPGDWYRQLKDHLIASTTLIALVTPESLENRWIHFECGLAEGMNVQVIPVCVGLRSLSDIPPPLNRYQSFQLSDYDSLRAFVGKLFSGHGLELFDEIAEPALKRAISDFALVTVRDQEVSRIQLEDVVEMLKDHIDERLLGAVGKTTPTDPIFVPYGITIASEPLRDEGRLELVTNIDSYTTVQSVLDNVYFAISKYVPPYSYMTKWLLSNSKTGRKLIVREIQHLIPAYLIFKPASKWEIELLPSPYVPHDSDERVSKNRAVGYDSDSY